MGMFFLKIFVGFWIIWILWYITGGPLRDDKSKPFVGITASGTIERTAPTK
jgi:hypothetical protein